MAVIVFAEIAEGEIKKSSLEALSYGSKVAGMLGTSLTAVVLGQANGGQVESLGRYGATKVLHATDARLHIQVSAAYASAVAQAAQAEQAKVVIMARSALADAMAPRVAARLRAGQATNAVELPVINGNDLTVKRSVFTSKAFSFAKLTGDVKVITIRKNIIDVAETGGSAQVEAFSPQLSDADFAVKHIKTEKATGDVLLPEAEIVVSGGRGLKGPENWNMLEDLAKALGAATACSKPVSDMDWRPHHEHVGQTGIKVSPNLYFAIGISGAIQHVAGIASSKVIVAINTDPEAPIFKAADYGIVGDAFKVVPRLTQAVKNG